MFTIDHSGDSDLSDNQSDLSDTDDMDLRPDSAMDRYRSQQTQNSHSNQRPSAMSLANFGHGDGEESFNTSFSPEGELAVSPSSKSPRRSSHKMEEYERSLDEDRHLLKEYEMLRELNKHQEQLLDPEHPPREPGRLKELRVPSAGPRPRQPRRTVNPLSTPFPMSMPEPPNSPGRESPHRDRPRKIK